MDPYGTLKQWEILPMQVTDKAADIGGGSIPYATGIAVDVADYLGWGRMSFDVWAHTGASGVTVANATGTITLTPWMATYAFNAGGTTHATATTGYFGKTASSTSALAVYDKPQGTATAFTAASYTNAFSAALNQERYFDADACERWVGAGVTIAGTGGPKFAFMASISMQAKSRPTV